MSGPFFQKEARMDDLISHYRKVHAAFLDDIKQLRSSGLRISDGNKDITEQWIGDQQRRADDLARVIEVHEKLDAAHKTGASFG
jgi:L-rhamnose isomerase